MPDGPRLSQLKQSGASSGQAAVWNGTEWAPATVGGGYTDPLTTKGDLVVRSSTTTTRLAVGTDTYVLTADSTQANGMKWAAAGGGGSSLVTVDDPSLWGTLLGETYEFDANTSSLPSGWSWVNQGGATSTEKYGVGSLAVTGNASYNNRCLIRAEPTASTYTAVFKLSYTLTGVASSPSAKCGLVLRNSTSGKLVIFARFSSGYFGLEHANSATSYSANTGLISTSFEPVGVVFFRIVKASATSYSLGVSADGVGWDDISTAYNPQTFLGAAVTDIGFCVESSATTRTATIGCHWLRVN